MTAPWDSLVTERVGIGDDLTLDVIYEPRGRVTKEMLFEDAIRLVANARGWHTPEQIDEMRKTYKFNPFLVADLICVVRRGERDVCGLCTFRFFDLDGEPIMHISNSSMSPELQGKNAMTYIAFAGLAKARQRLEGKGPPRQWVTLITQNPVVYGIFSSRGKMYPPVDGSPIPDDAKKVGSFIAKEFVPSVSFDPETFILRNECQFFYSDIPRWKDDRVNQWFDKNLRYYEGDTIVMVMKMDIIF
jgi:hypothetical protein